MSRPSDLLALDSLTRLHWIGIVAASVTAAVHVGLGVDIFPGTFGILFLFASAGYLVGIVAILLDFHRRYVYLLGIPFTAGQIVLWFALNQPIPPISVVEAIDKIAQIVLVVALVVLYRRERR